MPDARAIPPSHSPSTSTSSHPDSVYYLPEWLYDLFVILFLPLNFAIQLFASRLGSSRNAPNYTTDTQLQPTLLKQSIHMTPIELDQLRSTLQLSISFRNYSEKKNFIEPQLLTLFDTLVPATTELMYGNWKGNIILTHSWLDLCDRWIVTGILRRLNCEWGKRFRGLHVGDPLILTHTSKTRRRTFPVPVWGNVSVPSVLYRGVLNACMTYDYQPWQDHFRILHHGTDGKTIILGNWTARNKIAGWFTLETDQELNQAANKQGGFQITN